MDIYMILFWCFWVLMGLQAIAPHLSGGSFNHFSRGWKLVALIVFVLLGPLIAICNVVNVIILFLIGGEDDDDQGYP